jgi:transposase-like protein
VIAALTPAQRGQAWRALALAEAADSEDDETDRLVQPVSASLALTAPGEPAAASPMARPPNPAAAESIAALGQRRVDIIGCPHCEARDVMRWGQASAIPRYRCKACRRTFNALTKTPLAHLRMKEKWAAQAGAMIEGISLAKVAERLDVGEKTAFRWRHRFLASLADDKPRVLSGIVEGDETFILESFKGRRSGMPRPARNKRQQIGQTRPVGRTDSGDCRPRSSRFNHRRGAAKAEPGVDHDGTRRCCHAGERFLLRRRQRDCCLRPQGWHTDAYSAGAG